MTRMTQRITRFLRRGVKVVWLIDPDDRKVTVYLPDRAPEVLDADQELTGGDVLPGFRCRVADLFFVPGGEQSTQSPPPSSSTDQRLGSSQ
jgi:Uma2 family endonuclease